MVALNYYIYEDTSPDVFVTAVGLTAIAFWLLPWALTELICHVFKIKGEYGGTLQFDDDDPTDCKFRMIFNFDPEFLIGKKSFEVEVQKTDLHKRDRNND